jgi:hypothetical protein
MDVKGSWFDARQDICLFFKASTPLVVANLPLLVTYLGFFFFDKTASA